MVDLFLFHLLKKRHFTCKSMEIGITEGTLALIQKHYRVHSDL